jgi:hypothetical protein
MVYRGRRNGDPANAKLFLAVPDGRLGARRAGATNEEAALGRLLAVLFSIVEQLALDDATYHSLDAGQPPVVPTQVRVTTPALFVMVNVSFVVAAVAVTEYSVAVPDAALM